MEYIVGTQQFLNTPLTQSAHNNNPPQSQFNAHTLRRIQYERSPHTSNGISRPPYLGRVGRSEMVRSVVNDHSAMHAR